MTHEQAPAVNLDTAEVANHKLSSTEQASFARFSTMDDIRVVRDAGTEHRRIDGGWTLTGVIDHVDEDGAWVELKKSDTDGDITMVAALRGIEHFNPLELKPETSEVERRQEETEQLGHEAVAQTVELDDNVQETVEEPEQGDEIQQDTAEADTPESLRSAMIDIQKQLVEIDDAAQRDASMASNLYDALQLLSRQYANAAAEGPWSGNKLKDNRRLVGQSEQLISDARMFLRRFTKNTEAVQDAVVSTKSTAQYLEDEVAPTITDDVHTKKAKAVHELAEHVTNRLRGNVDSSETANLKRAISNLESMLSGYGETVDDGKTAVSRMLRGLEEVKDALAARRAIAKQGVSELESIWH